MIVRAAAPPTSPARMDSIGKPGTAPPGAAVTVLVMVLVDVAVPVTVEVLVRDVVVVVVMYAISGP